MALSIMCLFCGFSETLPYGRTPFPHGLTWEMHPPPPERCCISLQALPSGSSSYIKNFSIGLLFPSWASWLRRICLKTIQIWLSTDPLGQVTACCTIAQSMCPGIRVTPCNTYLQISQRGSQFPEAS